MAITQEQLAQMRADAEAGKRDAITGTLLALVCEHVLTLVGELEPRIEREYLENAEWTPPTHVPNDRPKTMTHYEDDV